MQPLARNTLFRSIFEVAELHGVSRKKILAEIDIDPLAAVQPGALVPSGSLSDAVEFAARSTGRSDFGLLLGAQQDHRSLGPIGILIEHCKTVAEAVAEGSRYLHLHNTALQYTMTPQEIRGRYAFRIRMRSHGRFVPKHYVEAIAVMFTRFCRLVLGVEWRPIEVLFEHERLGSPAAYRTAFGAPVRFQQEQSAIVASMADMERPITNANPRIKALVEHMLADLQQEQDDDMAARVTMLLRPLLGGAKATAPHVAKLMSIPVRTLQRRLAEQGTNFKKVLTDLRIQLAHEYLARGMTTTQLAGVLGLSEASAVSRFLRIHLGHTSSEIKVQARGSALVKSLPT